MTIEVNTTPVVLFVQQSVIFRWFIFAPNLSAIHITLVRKPQSHTCGFAPDLYVNVTQPSFPLLFLAPCSLPLPPCSLASFAPFPCFFTLLCAPFPYPFPMLLASCSFSICFRMFGDYRGYRACCNTENWCWNALLLDIQLFLWSHSRWSGYWWATITFVFAICICICLHYFHCCCFCF